MSWTEDEDRKQSLNETSSGHGHVHTEKKTEKDMTDPNKAIWSLLEKTLSENLIEKRRARRWRIFFRFTTLAIFLAVIGGWFAKSDFVGLLDAAYQNARLKGVVIEMNSPGGSPVHSGIIYDAIRAKEQNYPDIPVLVVVEDMAASGGYYIASAATEIYADKASLVGSIGVISSGFDASNLLEKIGVERRTFTAGRNKAFLDPFAPMTEEAKVKWQAVLDETHQQFINAVKEGRGDRLVITDDVFSGMVFTGSQAIKIGLIDGLASVNEILDARFPDAEPVFYEPKQDSWRELAKEFGVEMATRVINTTSIQ